MINTLTNEQISATIRQDGERNIQNAVAGTTPVSAAANGEGQTEQVEKVCFKCGKKQPRTEFYKHPMMGDGLLGKCKTCCKLFARQLKQVNKQNPLWVLDNRMKNRQYMEAKRRSGFSSKISQEHKKKWADKNKNKIAAQKLARSHFKNKQKPTNCEDCNCEGRLQMHHEDYSRPLDVNFLCTKCHAIRHIKKRALETLEKLK